MRSIAGPCISGEGFGMDIMILKDADVIAVFAENLPETIVNKYAEDILLSTDVKDKTQFLRDYYSVKGSFRSSLYATIASGNYNDEIAILRKKNCPVCIVFGKDEKVINTYYLDGGSNKFMEKDSL